MQQPKRFQAPTLAEAYERVRQELGASAVILSTRKAFAPGLFGQPGRQFVEVVARVPEVSPGQPATPTFEQDQAAHDLVRAVAEADASAPLARGQAFADFADFEEVAPLPDRLAPAVATSPTPVLPGPEAAPAVRADAPWRQLDQMRGLLDQLVAERNDARIEAAPAAVRSMKDRLVRHGLPSAVATGLVGDLEGIDPRDEQAVAAAVERRLAAQLPSVAPVNVRRRRAIFLVGPSGAGKTTLALRLALDIEREYGLHVVVAGTDVNRAGAPQQLTAVGAVTGLDVRLCYEPEELTAILEEPGVDLVIVDTAGHSGRRRDRMADLTALLQVARQRAVLLTVPATMKGGDVQEMVSAYSAVGVDGLAVTRCDETSHFGDVAGVAIESSVGLAYLTYSEQVSDPPVAADNAAVAAAVVHGRWQAAAGEPSDERDAVAPRPLAKVG